MDGIPDDAVEWCEIVSGVLVRQLPAIYEFVSGPSALFDENSSSERRFGIRLLVGEFHGVADFARLFMNPYYSYRKIEALLRTFDIEHHFI
jgi:hypothetical protein